MLPAGLPNADRIIPQHRIHINPPGQCLKLQNFPGGRYRAQVGQGLRLLKPQQHFLLLSLRRVAQLQADEKTIQLSLGQRKGAFQLNGVLRGDNQKGRRQRHSNLVHGQLPLGHSFQQSRLGARRGPVDFIGQHDLGDDGAGPKLELPAFLVIVVDAGDVRRHQIRRELNPLELAIQGISQGPGQGRLANARHILDQDMPPAQHGGQGQLHHFPLAHQGLPHIALNPGHSRGHPADDFRSEDIGVHPVSPGPLPPARRPGGALADNPRLPANP